MDITHFAEKYYQFGFNVTCFSDNHKKDFTFRDTFKNTSKEWGGFSNKKQSYYEFKSLDWNEANGIGVILGFNNLRAIEIFNCKNFSLIQNFLTWLGLPSDYEWVIRSGSTNSFSIVFYSFDHEFHHEPTDEGNNRRINPSIYFENVFDYLELRWKGLLNMPPSFHTSHFPYMFQKDKIPIKNPAWVSKQKINQFICHYCPIEAYKFLSEYRSYDYLYSKKCMIDVGEQRLKKESYQKERDEYSHAWDKSVLKASGLSEININNPYILLIDVNTIELNHTPAFELAELNDWPGMRDVALTLYDGNRNIFRRNHYVIRPDSRNLDKREINVEYGEMHWIAEGPLGKLKNDLDFYTQYADLVIGHDVLFNMRVLISDILRHQLYYFPGDSYFNNYLSSIRLFCTSKSMIEVMRLPGKEDYKLPSLSELHEYLFDESIDETDSPYSKSENLAKCFFEMRDRQIIDCLIVNEDGYANSKQAASLPIAKNNKSNLSESYYLFFDVETIGLPKSYEAPVKDIENWPRLVQLAYIVYDTKGVVLMKDNMIIKPDGFLIPKESTDLHGITNEFAFNQGKEIKAALTDDFLSAIKKANLIIGHNISFDSRIVSAEFLRMGQEDWLSNKKVLCTMKASTDFCKIPSQNGYKWPKLSELYFKLFNEELEGAHDAFIDVQATAKCFWELKSRGVIKIDEK